MNTCACHLNRWVIYFCTDERRAKSSGGNDGEGVLEDYNPLTLALGVEGFMVKPGEADTATTEAKRVARERRGKYRDEGCEGG